MNLFPYEGQENLLRLKAKAALGKLFERDERAGRPVISISPLSLAQRAYYELYDPKKIAPLPSQALAICELERLAREVCRERNRAQRKGNRATGGSQ